MLAALGLDGIRRRLDELGLALAGILIGLVGVCAPWFDLAGAGRLGLLEDNGRFGLVALLAGLVLLWRYSNLGGPGNLFGVLLAGVTALLVGVAELIQLEATYGDVHQQAAYEPRWGLWVLIIGASITVLGALVAAQLHANRGAAPDRGAEAG